MASSPLWDTSFSLCTPLIPDVIDTYNRLRKVLCYEVSFLWKCFEITLLAAFVWFNFSAQNDRSPKPQRLKYVAWIMVRSLHSQYFIMHTVLGERKQYFAFRTTALLYKASFSRNTLSFVIHLNKFKRTLFVTTVKNKTKQNKTMY